MLQSKCEIQITQRFRISDNNPLDVNSSPLPNLSPIDQQYQILNFNTFNSITVDRSWDNLTQTANIILPRKLKKVVGNLYDVNITQNEGQPIVHDENIINDLTKPGVSLISPLIGYPTFGPDGTFYKINPLISIGDIITISIGYIIRNNGAPEVDTVEEGGGNQIVYTINNNQIVSNNSPDGVRNLIFYGYVTKLDILQDGNISIGCEDYMYYLKRAAIPNNTFHANDPIAAKKYNQVDPIKFTNKKGWSINAILSDMLESPMSYIANGVQQIQGGGTSSGIQNASTLPTPLYAKGEQSTTVYLNNGLAVVSPSFDINSNIDTVLGDIGVGNATVGKVLEQLKNDYEIPSYFVYNFATASTVNAKLYCSTFKYKDRNTEQLINATGSNALNRPTCQWNKFTFGENIIDSKLEWKNTEDLQVGALVKTLYYLTDTKDDGSAVTTKRSKKKKKRTIDLAIPVGDANGTLYTFFYLTSNATYTDSDLTQLKADMYNFGLNKLNEVHYTGYFGSFTTFGYPYIEFGDIIYIEDPLFSERNGTYFVKRVVYNADFETGLTQTITIDFKIPDLINTPK